MEILEKLDIINENIEQYNENYSEILEKLDIINENIEQYNENYSEILEINEIDTNLYQTEILEFKSVSLGLFIGIFISYIFIQGVFNFD